MVRRDVRFRHPLEAGLRVGEFLDMTRRRPRLRQLTRPWGRPSGDVDDLERDAL